MTIPGGMFNNQFMKNKKCRPYRSYKVEIQDGAYCCPAIGEYGYLNRAEIERAIDARIQLKKSYLVEQGKIDFNG